MHVHDHKWEKSNKKKSRKNNRLNSISGSLIKGNNIYYIKIKKKIHIEKKKKKIILAS